MTMDGLVGVLRSLDVVARHLVPLVIYALGFAVAAAGICAIVMIIGALWVIGRHDLAQYRRERGK
mgnify:FL=1